MTPIPEPDSPPRDEAVGPHRPPPCGEACGSAPTPLPPHPTLALWLTHRTVPCWCCSEAQARALAEALPQATLLHCRTRQAFLEALPQADIALVWRFEQAWFERAPRLRWIATPAAGRDYFRISPPPTCRVTYGSFHGELIAETVLAMLLAECRGLVASLRAERDDPWPQALLARHMRPLRGARVTLLGFGHIGAWIGRLAKPFGVHLTGVRRHPTAPRPDYFDRDDRICTLEQLDALLPGTDHLVLALPGGPDTDGLLNAARLARLPAHAVLYNVGRGNAIDETALAEALTAGRLAGAYLDVFAEEPLALDAPLRACPNTVLMPHASAIAPNYLELFFREFQGLLSRAGA